MWVATGTGVITCPNCLDFSVGLPAIDLGSLFFNASSPYGSSPFFRLHSNMENYCCQRNRKRIASGCGSFFLYSSTIQEHPSPSYNALDLTCPDSGDAMNRERPALLYRRTSTAYRSRP